ncbi:MAG: response regulator [Deltaproteobacteria bacterium]|nr:response regulator [Deltaproteobacteria bacterium]MDQ3295858.1 response regulator [Myxococcota bacterium]
MASRPKQVLLIDDNELTLRMVAKVLSHAGYQVRTASNVEELTSALGEWRPDVILTDVNMPGTSGVELCRRLKATYETAHVPVVLLSALPEAELELLARTCEADGYLTKSNLAQLPTELQMLVESLF